MISPATDPRKDDHFAPVFIVGPERSGTTLLAVLLDRHPQLAIPPETHFLVDLEIKKRQLARLHTHREFLEVLPGLGRIADLGLDPERLAHRFQQYPPECSTLFRSLLEVYAAEHDKPRVGEKSPTHLLHVPKLMRWYEHAKVICMMRDGRDVVLSLMQAPWAHSLLRMHCENWVQLVGRCRQLEAAYPQQFRRVHYERLVADPAGVVEEVDRFIGVPFCQTQLDPSVGSDVVPQWEQDWKGRAVSSINSARVGRWRREAAARELKIMNRIMGEALRSLGYPDVDPAGTGPRWSDRLAVALERPVASRWNRFRRMARRRTAEGRSP